MNKTLRFLLLEDVPADAEIIEHELRKGDFLFTLKRVKTEKAFQEALKELKPDIILADYKLPSYDGISALRFVEKCYPDIPFIFVSGYRGEELAIETLKSGAKDYVLKDNLLRLVPSVRFALSGREEQIKRKQAEEELKKAKQQLEIIFSTIADGVVVFDDTGKLLYVNDVGAKLKGFSSSEEMLKVLNIEFVWKRIQKHFEILDEFGNAFSLDQLPCAQALKGEITPEATICLRDKIHSNTQWMLIKSRPVFYGQRNVQMVVNVICDITQHMEQEKRKDEFIIAASHELKSPVTSLKAFAQLLEKLIDKNNDEKYKHCVIKIDRQADKLTELIDNLLDLSKIQAGKMEFQKKPFDLNTWIKEIAGDMEVSTNKHRILVKGRVTRKIYGDKDRLSQVVMNLLSNAVKFTPEVNNVIINLIEDKDKVTIAVQDFGIGIEEQYQDKIFDRFFRISNANRITFPGLGIGLYISQQIVKRHGGDIWVESAKDKGSTFYFTIPFKLGK